MSPENRTPSGLGPLPQRSKLLVGSALASLGLVLGLAGPALAAAPGHQASAAGDCVTVQHDADGVRIASSEDPGDRCHEDKGDKKDKGDCHGIDSAGNEQLDGPPGATYLSVVCDGKVYVLSVNEATAPSAPVGTWQFVGGPTNVVEATVASNSSDIDGGPVFITALTETGVVWRGVCPEALPLGSCSFAPLPTLPQ
ncbi:hypothetical protein [Streptomyces sp. NPDC002133]|uniref:hypothetical protein n=1 Tax=Streptomyces sp. NPDC002133 TaxID=3154409 RepID=UPI00332A69A3